MKVMETHESTRGSVGGLIPDRLVQWGLMWSAPAVEFWQKRDARSGPWTELVREWSIYFIQS